MQPPSVLNTPNATNSVSVIARRKAPGKCLAWCLNILALCLLAACNKTENQKTADGGAEESTSASTAAAATQAPNLALRLKVGDRFPLQKSITTIVMQPGENGTEKSMAAKEFLLTVTVEAMPESGPRAGQKQMGVQFHAVKFQREIQGKKLMYDSRTAKEPLPMVVRPYHGLVGNSFSFWLGAENQIEGIVEFKAFLERCLKNVPEDRYAEVWNNLESQSGVYGIANFVDDSIGLLPTTKVKTGETWTVTRQTQQPVPMICKNRYTLQHLDDKQAEVSILGDIIPAAFSIDAVPQAAEKGVQLSIKGGKSSGNCTIDLRTGLPIHSQVEQFVDMVVKLKDGQEFTQHKQTITIIRAFPNMSEAIDADEVTVRQKTRGNVRPHYEPGEKASKPARTALPGNRVPQRQ
ncbi:MAG: hypothetical protein JWM11_7716 [Planctomycetaceae bacterium]|nr:hypothetical protein [Planctomycetaceae bacterium]